MVRLDAVGRQFGGSTVFEGVSWTLTPGARVALVGPNGAGKTTLLRLLAGRDRPDTGAVHAPRNLRVGYLPQEVETVGGGSVLSVVLDGFPQIAEIEESLEDVERRMAAAAPDDPAANRLARRYGELRERYEHLDGHRLEARARSILSGLGVEQARFHEPIERLSGGWRMRAVLARLLLGGPDLLLLDEPTNHLDLEAIAWLEGFLSSFEGAFVVVSHDRYFLNRMVSEIAELDRGRLIGYPGNYDAWIEAKAARREGQEKAAKQQARERAKTRRFIERFRYKNTKARQVQARIRALDKTEEIEVEAERRGIRFGFPPAPRSGTIVVRAAGVRKRFGAQVVYDGLELVVRRGDRVAILGPNGAGKSTLLKLLSGRLAHDAGAIELGHNVVADYYAQHQLDELDPRATVYEEMERVAPAELRPRIRTLLGSFLFAGDDVQKRVEVLSGGEKARLALVRLLARPTNLLLMDEPTNHLDTESREVLEDALDEYGGTLLIVSHDRYFINRVATSVAEVGDGRIEVYPGDYDEFADWKRAHADRRATVPAAPPRPADGRADRKEARRREAEERNRRYRERRAREQRLAPLEAEIERLETRRAEVERSLTDPSVYSDPARAGEAGRAVAQIDERLEELYREWEDAADTTP